MEWRGVEIHPETPEGGRPLTELFRKEDVDGMMAHLRSAGAPFGITFADRPFLSNSRRALQAAEFAREHGKFDRLHPALFSAYFSQALDIGSMDVLLKIGQEAGLDTAAMEKAIMSNAFMPKLAQAQEDAGKAGVTGVPTFVINGRKTIVGAQPLDVFRKALRSV